MEKARIDIYYNSEGPKRFGKENKTEPERYEAEFFECKRLIAALVDKLNKRTRRPKKFKYAMGTALYKKPPRQREKGGKGRRGEGKAFISVRRDQVGTVEQIKSAFHAKQDFEAPGVRVMLRKYQRIKSGAIDDEILPLLPPAR